MKIKKSMNADTRTLTDTSKAKLMIDTMSHIDDVGVGIDFIINLLKSAKLQHDHTKLDELDRFYADFSTGAVNDNFKSLAWWQLHMQERHHLNDRVPDDVTLVDVIEMVVDCCMAGMARSGEVYDIDIPNDVLQLAVQNTKKLLIENIEVE